MNKKAALHQKLVGVYSVLIIAAYQATSANSDIPMPALDSIKATVERWADRYLILVGEIHDLAESKRKLINAFSELIQRHTDAANSVESKSNQCRVCGGQLSNMFYDLAPLTCTRCVRPVQMALDELVQASTRLFMPEQIFKQWLSALDDFEEAGQNS